MIYLVLLENTWARGSRFSSRILNEILPKSSQSLTCSHSREFRSFYSDMKSCSDQSDGCAGMIMPHVVCCCKADIKKNDHSSFVSGMTPVSLTATSNRFHLWVMIWQIGFSGHRFCILLCWTEVNWGYIFASFAGKFENGVAEGTVDPSLNPISSFRLSVIQNSAVWAILNEVRGGIAF